MATNSVSFDTLFVGECQCGFLPREDLMKPSVRFLIFLAICITAIAVGCDGSTQTQKDEPPARKRVPAFLKAFSDFEFVGSGPVGHDVEVPPHSPGSKAFPSDLEADVAYIFHHRRLDDDDEKLFEVLQNRLKTNGVTILEAKVGPYRHIGGAEFLITFTESDIKGTILTSLDWQIMNIPALSAQWDPDDYVVILKTVGASSSR